MNSKNLGIYIHVPFCVSKCPYCDFYSVSPENTENYVRAVCREIKKWGYNSKNIVDTIYFGGGTPSLLKSDMIFKIIECIYENFKILNPEITIEVNPADYVFLDFKKLKEFGLNRVSVGAQSFSDLELRSLGRRHRKNDILMTVNLLKKAQIENISLDLMLGIPYQTKKSIKNFVDFAIENNIKHISAYLLKIEEGTQFYFNRDKLNLPSDDQSAEFYEYVIEILEKSGYKQYEISNFSVPNFESKHNLKYWNLDEYIGIGPSAHSLFGGKRFYFENSLQNFIEYSTLCNEGDFEPEIEYVMLRLRLAEGLDFKKFNKKFDKDIPEIYFERAEKFAHAGFLVCDESGMRLTKKGFIMSNTIIREILG